MVLEIAKAHPGVMLSVVYRDETFWIQVTKGTDSRVVMVTQELLDDALNGHEAIVFYIDRAIRKLEE